MVRAARSIRFDSNLASGFGLSRHLAGGFAFPSASAAPPVAYWRADTFDAANDRLTDLSGNGLHARRGSLVGADTNDPHYLPYSGTRYLHSPGVAGNFVSVPDSAAVSVTGDIELQASVSFPVLPPTSNVPLIQKGGTSTLAYALQVNSTGTVTASVSSTGATFTGATSTVTLQSVGITAGQRVWLVATVNVDLAGNSTTFYYSTDGATFTQLGAVVASTGQTAIADTSAQVEIGTAGGAAAGAADFYWVKVLNGLGGPVVLNVDFSTASEPYATMAAATGQTVTFNRSSSGRKLALVDRPMFAVGGDDYFEVADNALLNFGAADSFTVAVAFRTHALNDATFGSFIGKKASTALADLGWVLYHDNANELVTINRSDGTTNSFVNSAVGAVDPGEAQVVAAVHNEVGPSGQVFADGVGGGISAGSLGSLTNALPVRIGARSGASPSNFGSFEFFAAAVWRRALSASEITNLDALFGTNV